MYFSDYLLITIISYCFLHACNWGCQHLLKEKVIPKWTPYFFAPIQSEHKGKTLNEVSASKELYNLDIITCLSCKLPKIGNERHHFE